jgi:opacity protein-like surface antigen
MIISHPTWYCLEKIMKHTESFRIAIRRFLPLFVMILALLYTSSNAVAQSTNPQESSSGFRIGETRFFLGAHAGMDFPRAGHDLFRMITRELTLEKKDFRSALFRFDFGYAFQSHYAMVLAVEYSKASPVSESRPFTNEDGSPIVQTTELRQIPVTATFRYYPIKMGEHVGSLAYIPHRFLPYIGAGGGFMRYDFTQAGSFVDNQTLDIFDANFESSGFAPVAHIATGIDIGITSKLALNFEANYSFAHAKLSKDFEGFHPIDLAGFKTTGGIYFRF